MEWLSGAFNGTMIAAMVGAVAVTVLHAFNPPGSEPKRKGWHPVTKACLWTFATVTLLAFGIALSQSLGWI